MALTTTEMLKLASSQINKNYGGDPLVLKSFIDSINLLNSLATTAELKTFSTSFIRTKLEGKARELLNDSDTTVKDIIQLFKQE